MYIKQISIFVTNKSGRMAEVTRILAERGVNILALSIADTVDYGILRLIVADPESAEIALKESGLTFKITNVVGIAVDHHPGGLSNALLPLTATGMSVEYMYAFVGTNKDNAMVILKVDDNDAAIKYLKDAGVTVLTQEDIEKL